MQNRGKQFSVSDIPCSVHYCSYNDVSRSVSVATTIDLTKCVHKSVAGKNSSSSSPGHIASSEISSSCSFCLSI